jgi:hypothetical protein
MGAARTLSGRCPRFGADSVSGGMRAESDGEFAAGAERGSRLPMPEGTNGKLTGLFRRTSPYRTALPPRAILANETRTEYESLSNRHVACDDPPPSVRAGARGCHNSRANATRHGDRPSSAQIACSPDSRVRMRTMSARSVTKTLPSPTLPVPAEFKIASMAAEY